MLVVAQLSRISSFFQ